jgi:hypothetical protein
MVQMIPAEPRAGANKSEIAIFDAFEAIVDRPDWIVIHSLALTVNLFGLQGEADFVVFVPNKGILVIEAKSPKYAEYKGGDWYLDRVPKPEKSPLEQLNKATANIHSFLANRSLYKNFPIARLLWFTSLGRHQFENKTPGDMQFFEWELALRDDLAKPAKIVEKVLDEYWKFQSQKPLLGLQREGFDKVAAEATSGALVNDFKMFQTAEDRQRERAKQLAKQLSEQVALLDLVETNEHIYFDGSAGTGKSFLLMAAARNLAKQGTRTLVLCWNLMMAEEIQRQIGGRANLDVRDFNTLMLEICGLQSNPNSADSTWYEAVLVARAIEVLVKNPHLGDYEAILVDEFQDIAGNPPILEMLALLSANKQFAGTKLIFAGDLNQQIMRGGAKVNPLQVAKVFVPDFVHVRLRTNCRMAPALANKMEGLTGLNINVVKHRLASSTDGGLDIVRSTDEKATKALASILKLLLSEYRPQDIRILSPFGVRNSLVGELFSRESKSADERWLKTVLKHTSGSGGDIRWRSISKYKGLEADVVVLTDINQKAMDFVALNDKSLSELLYVGASRAKFRCVVIASAEASLGKQ